MRVLAQQVSIQVIVAIFLTNLHGILNGNLTQHYFSVEPPTLSEYLWETGTEVQTFSSSLRKLSESSWGAGVQNWQPLATSSHFGHNYKTMVVLWVSKAIKQKDAQPVMCF